MPTRRNVLRSGLVAGTTTLVFGTRRLARRAVQPSAGVTIASKPLMLVNDRIVSLWNAAPRGFPIRVVQPPFAASVKTNWAAGDLLDFDPLWDDPRHYPVLDADLRAYNFDRRSIVPAALDPFARIPGGLRGLPYFLSEPVFYAHSERLRQLGVAEPERWTFDGMRDVLELARARAAPGDDSPLIVGVDAD